MIVHDTRNPRACEFADRLCSDLPKEWLADAERVVVIGGDGFMLRTIREQGLAPVYIGLNAGHLGFLLNDVGSVDRIAQQLTDGDWAPVSFPVLDAEVFTSGGEQISEQAINDVYLERSTGQTARLSIAIDGHTVVRQLVSDGVIFSTALGSTAYNFSAGGTACHPSLNLLTITPICPHHPRLNPFILPPASRARVDVIDRHKRPVRAVVDGRQVADITHVELGIGDSVVQLGYLEGHDFTGQMVKKILHP